MAVRDPNNPICWVGHDRLVLDDVTRFGLHRKVVARKDGMPDIEAWKHSIRIECPDAKVESWTCEINGFTYLWLVWKGTQ